MRKNVLVIAGLAVLSTSAFASKARMSALGQGSTSFYVQDSRSVFLNPAALNDMKNYVVTEWGATQNTDATARAEGGFFREQGSFAYGLYLGNNGPARTTGTHFFQDAQNNIDLIFAGDMGMKWGARVHYASAKQEASSTLARKNSGLGLGLGVVHGDLDVSANITVSDKSTGSTLANLTAGTSGDEWKRKPGFDLNAVYRWNGMSFFGQYANVNETMTLAAGSSVSTWTPSSIYTTAITTAASSSNTHKSSVITLGGAKVHEVNPGARVVTDARLILTSDEIGGSSTAAMNGKTKVTRLPVTFAVEADATSWLTLRGSISQSITGGKKTIAGQTQQSATNTAAAGATLNFGKLKLDGTVTNAATGALDLDNVLTNVAMTYNF